jgi:hypothetical protein
MVRGEYTRKNHELAYCVGLEEDVVPSVLALYNVTNWLING